MSERLSCRLCGAYFQSGTRVVGWSCGALSPCRKRKGFYFEPSVFPDGEEEILFHANCLSSYFNTAAAANAANPIACHICDHELVEDGSLIEWVNYDVQYKGGRLLYVPCKNRFNFVHRALLCWGCVVDDLGEGDDAEAERLLGFELGLQDV